MISHKKKFIFIHIPKSGGTSLSYAFLNHGIVLQGDRNFESIYFKHIDALNLKEKLGDEFDKYFKFTIVRNPFDWCVSNYTFNRGLHRPYVKGTNFEVSKKPPSQFRNMSFEEWLPWWLETFNPSMKRMIIDEQENVLVDYIEKYENLKKEYYKLCLKLKLFPFRKLPHKNRRKKEHFSTFYNKNSIPLVTSYFKEEFKMFKYPIDL